MKAISVILKDRQGTLISDVWHSGISVFSLIEVLLNFLEYLRRVLFPRKMISLTGLVLIFVDT